MDVFSRADVCRSFFPLDGKNMRVMEGEWVRSSPLWRAHGSVGPTEFVMNDAEEIVRVRRGKVSLRVRKSRIAS